mgnify:CR=1 FL=1
MQGDFFLTTWFLEAMKWVYSNVNSVFFTILICTIVLRGLTIFSDIATRKSQAKMNGIQPELAKIQKKYANDPQKAQMMSQKLMKERGVSMWGSCLPLLITMPLFFCFIAAFRFWGYEETIKLLVSDNAEELLRSFKFLWVNNIWQPDNGLSPVIQEGSKFLANVKDLDRLLYLQNNPEVWEKLVQLGIAVNEGGAFRFLNTQAAIDAYNAVVEGGTDEFGFVADNTADAAMTEGPWYACRKVPTVHHTMGGIRVNVESEACNADGEPIPGLYAAGECTGGIHGENRLGGNAIADCMTFGRNAGTNAAKYALA